MESVVPKGMVWPWRTIHSEFIDDRYRPWESRIIEARRLCSGPYALMSQPRIKETHPQTQLLKSMVNYVIDFSVPYIYQNAHVTVSRQFQPWVGMSSQKLAQKSNASAVFSFYLAQFCFHVTKGVLFQPLFLAWAFQAAAQKQMTLVDAIQQLRGTPGKSLWDGLLPKIVHTFAVSFSQGLVRTSLCKIFSIPNSAATVYRRGALPPNELRAVVRTKAWHQLQEYTALHISNVIVAALTAPLATIRCRIEAQGVSPDLPIRWTGWDAPIKCFSDIVKEEGYEALFAGLSYDIKTSAFSFLCCVAAYVALQISLSPMVSESEIGQNLLQLYEWYTAPPPFSTNNN